MTIEEVLSLIIKAKIIIDGCGEIFGDYDLKSEYCQKYIEVENEECLACKALSDYLKEKAK